MKPRPLSVTSLRNRQGIRLVVGYMAEKLAPCGQLLRKRPNGGDVGRSIKRKAPVDARLAGVPKCFDDSFLLVGRSHPN
jgi:hypothetical protein